MNKVKIILLVFISLLCTSDIWSAYQTNMTVSVSLKNQDYPIVWTWISITSTNWGSENIILLTNSSGIVTFWYKYDSEVLKDLNLTINWNYISLTKITNEMKTININYDVQTQNIRDITWRWATISFTNQWVLQSTNYKVLLIYIFITLLIATILLGGRYLYTILDRDIYKH